MPFEHGAVFVLCAVLIAHWRAPSSVKLLVIAALVVALVREQTHDCHAPPQSATARAPPSVSARKGEYTPNPRHTANALSDSGDVGAYVSPTRSPTSPEIGIVANARTFGHALFRHVLKPTEEWYARAARSALEDAIANGFRP